MNLAARGWYSFVVATDANKAEIGQAVKTMYKVTVKDVRTITVNGKMKRSGKRQKPVKQQAWKKASVLLAEGQTIDAFQIGGETQK